MDDKRSQKPAHTHRGWKALLAAGGALTMTQCTSVIPMRTSHTDNWTAPEGVVTGNERLLSDYRTAYRAFEAAADNALRAAKTQKATLTGLLTHGKLNPTKGLNVVFKPGASRLSECYLTTQSDSEVIMRFPEVAALFDAYAALCRVQNQIDPAVAEGAKLIGAPTPQTLEQFMIERLEQMPADERISQSTLKFLLGFIENPLSAASAYTQARPRYKMEDTAAFRELLLAGEPTDYDAKSHTLTFFTPKARTLPIPSKLQLMEWKRELPEESPIREAIDILVGLQPLEEQEGRKFEHNMRVLLLFDVPISIKVINPNFRHAQALNAPPAGVSR
jgi:hypothetical protein